MTKAEVAGQRRAGEAGYEMQWHRMAGQSWERLGKERGRQLLKVAWISVESFYRIGKREKGKSLLLFLAKQLNCSTSLDWLWVVMEATL